MQSLSTSGNANIYIIAIQILESDVLLAAHTYSMHDNKDYIS